MVLDNLALSSLRKMCQLMKISRIQSDSELQRQYINISFDININNKIFNKNTRTIEMLFFLQDEILYHIPAFHFAF